MIKLRFFKRTSEARYGGRLQQPCRSLGRTVGLPSEWSGLGTESWRPKGDKDLIGHASYLLAYSHCFVFFINVGGTVVVNAATLTKGTKPT
jgi:hypothetical protein